ncbi:MAG: hypothetical protein HUK08_07215, partial [Bacteroidaceae bacterium]|nr:hypothetical protein [Bacteroidaceae bacterium]
NKGKISNDKLQVMATSPKLSSEEINVIKKKDWFLDSNSYDKFYDMVHSAIKKLKKKDSEDKLTYRGSYEEGRHTIFILKYGKTQVEVVDKCWQIRRLKYKDEKGNMYFEFYEASPGVFLPISCNADMQVSSQEKNLEGNIKLRMAYKYSNVSK